MFSFTTKLTNKTVLRTNYQLLNFSLAKEMSSMKYTKIKTKEINMRLFPSTDSSMDGGDRINGKFRFRDKVTTKKRKEISLLSWKIDNLDNIYFTISVSYFSFSKVPSTKWLQSKKD